MPQYGWMTAVCYKTINETNVWTHQIVGQPTLVGTVDTHIHCIQHIYIDILDEAITEVLNKTYVNKTWDKYEQATQKNMQTILLTMSWKETNRSELTTNIQEKATNRKVYNIATVQFTTV